MNDLSLYTSALRATWKHRRRQMEADRRRRYTRAGVLPKRKLMKLTHLVEPIVALTGLRRWVLDRTLDVGLTDVQVRFPRLPAAFDGYKILLISDLHVGRLPGLIERAADLIRDVPVDMAVLAGDIQSWGTPAAPNAVEQLMPLLDALDIRDGVFAVLGNHDSHELAEPLEAVGIRVLINDHAMIGRGDALLRVTGLDDVNTFYTDDAERALRTPSQADVSVALVHSPEMADVAADAGYDLYLAGHTHGGQICLPGGRPIVTAIDHHRDLASGLWSYDRMAGYTSRGLGVARRVRVNCPPEIALLHLCRS